MKKKYTKNDKITLLDEILTLECKLFKVLLLFIEDEKE